jgi:energy-coupling factor transport system ATP-binding protein
MPLTRLAALRAAVLLSVGFVALRVLYRILFGGASGDGLLLFEIPRIRLVGPFSHISLFGPVTTGGLASAASSAVPFAVLVLAIGLLSVVVDLRAILARGAVRGPLRVVSRALVIAWATFPALLDSVRRVRVARELRGERGPASLVVPVLEQAVERAIALGASMEVRGFAATRPAVPSCERPATLVDVSLGYGNRWVLEGVNLALRPATLVLVAGSTGSGKSTLLHAMSGLFQHHSGGRQIGTVEVAGVDRSVPPRETARFLGVVSQSVRLSFVAPTVAEEIGFALANRGVAIVIVRERVREIAARLDISHLLDRPVVALSAGEACLVAIAAALVEHPVLLLVDEPLADLDARARLRVIDVLDKLAHEAGVCVVVAEHAVRDWGGAPDVRLQIVDGSVRAVDAFADVVESVTAPVQAAARIGEIRDLSVSYGDRLAVDHVSLDLFAGEIVALRGENGAGKSSLLFAMARPVSRGAVIVEGHDVRGMRALARRRAIALVPEAYDDLLFTTTVAEECRRADHGAGTKGTAASFAELLGRDGLLQHHPRDLSAGERLCLVLAIQLSARPSVLLVDEPSRGLDASARALVGRALLRAASSGAAVLVATHDVDFAARYSSRTLAMDAGRLRAGVAS